MNLSFLFNVGWVHAGSTSSLQGISNYNHIKYHGPQNKLSCLTQKGNSFVGKIIPLRSTQNDFLSIQVSNSKHNYLHSCSFYHSTLSWKRSCTVNLTRPAGVAVKSQETWNNWERLMLLGYQKLLWCSVSQKEQHWQDQDKIHSLRKNKNLFAAASEEDREVDLYLGKTDALKKKIQFRFCAASLLFHELTHAGLKESRVWPQGSSDAADWSTSRLQYVPRRCNVILRPRNSLLALHAINFHEQFNPTLTEAVGHLSILSSKAGIRAYLSFHSIPYL